MQTVRSSQLRRPAALAQLTIALKYLPLLSSASPSICQLWLWRASRIVLCMLQTWLHPVQCRMLHELRIAHRLSSVVALDSRPNTTLSSRLKKELRLMMRCNLSRAVSLPNRSPLTLCEVFLCTIAIWQRLTNETRRHSRAWLRRTTWRSRVKSKILSSTQTTRLSSRTRCTLASTVALCIISLATL